MYERRRVRGILPGKHTIIVQIYYDGKAKLTLECHEMVISLVEERSVDLLLTPGHTEIGAAK